MPGCSSLGLGGGRSSCTSPGSVAYGLPVVPQASQGSPGTPHPPMALLGVPCGPLDIWGSLVTILGCLWVLRLAAIHCDLEGDVLLLLLQGVAPHDFLWSPRHPRAPPGRPSLVWPSCWRLWTLRVCLGIPWERPGCLCVLHLAAVPSDLEEGALLLLLTGRTPLGFLWSHKLPRTPPRRPSLVWPF